jgi:hypothetical protein
MTATAIEERLQHVVHLGVCLHWRSAPSSAGSVLTCVVTQVGTTYRTCVREPDGRYIGRVWRCDRGAIVGMETRPVSTVAEVDALLIPPLTAGMPEGVHDGAHVL